MRGEPQLAHSVPHDVSSLRSSIGLAERRQSVRVRVRDTGSAFGHPDFPRFISECKTPYSECLAFILKNAIRLIRSVAEYGLEKSIRYMRGETNG